MDSEVTGSMAGFKYNKTMMPSISICCSIQRCRVSGFEPQPSQTSWSFSLDPDGLWIARSVAVSGHHTPLRSRCALHSRVATQVPPHRNKSITSLSTTSCRQPRVVTQTAASGWKQQPAMTCISSHGQQQVRREASTATPQPHASAYRCVPLLISSRHHCPSLPDEWAPEDVPREGELGTKPGT